MIIHHYRKKIKKSLLFITFLFFSSILLSQTTFNKYFNILDYINLPLYIIPDTNNIYCIGYGTNDNPYNHYGIFFASFDLKGKLLIKNFYKESTPTFYGSLRLNNAFVIGEKIYTIMGKSGGDYDLFLEVDKNSGEIYKKIKIKNNLISGGSIGVVGMERVKDNLFAVFSNITEEVISDTTTTWHVDPQISLINIISDSIRYLNYGKANINDTGECFKWANSKYIIPNLKLKNRSNEEGYRAQSRINIVDTLGNVLTVFSTDPDSLRGGVRDIASGPDGAHVFADTKVRQYWIDGWDEYMLIYKPVLFKLDSNYNLKWELEIGGDRYPAYHRHGQVIRVLPAIEGDGYVVMSRMGNKIVPETNEDGDTTSYGEILMYYGIVDRISESGELLWTRYYSIIHDDITENLLTAHEVNDFEYGPDGGYMLCGNLNYYQHKVWLLKMDKYGCLIPGCQDTSSTSNFTIPNLPIKIYPNPVSDELYIYQSSSKTIHYTILDMQGTKMTDFTGDNKEGTMILPIFEYPPGTYILHAETKDGRRGVKKFVVLRE